MKLSELQERTKLFLKKQDRTDAEFRLALTVSQIGDLAKYITHDNKLNPRARPYGTREDERICFGHAFAMLASLAEARKVDIEEAVKTALKEIEEKEWAAKEAKNNERIEGITASKGTAEGKAFVLTSQRKAHEMPEKAILVVQHGGAELTQAIARASALVADHGSPNTHLAIIAREFKIPCIVATGNATQRIKTGEKITVYAEGEKGWVEKID